MPVGVLLGRRQCADLVAVVVAQIGEIHTVLASAGRVLDARTAVLETGRMKGVALLVRVDRESDGAAVSMRRGLAVDRDRDREDAFRADVEVATVVVDPGADAERAERWAAQISLASTMFEEAGVGVVELEDFAED